MKRMFALFTTASIAALTLLVACAAPVAPAAPAAPAVSTEFSPTQQPAATAIPIPEAALPGDNKPECEGFLPYSVNGNPVYYWVFSMNFRVWSDQTRPVGCLLVYHRDENGKLQTTGRVSVDTCKVNGTIITNTMSTSSTPLSIIPQGPQTVALATFDGQSYIQCSFNLSKLLPMAKDEFETQNLQLDTTQRKALPKTVADGLTVSGGYEEYGYLAMGGFGMNLVEGSHPIFYFQPKTPECNAAKPGIVNRVAQSDSSKATIIENYLCNPIAFSVNVLTSTAKLQAMLNGDWAAEGCSFLPRPTQQWSAGLDFLEWRDNFGYYQYDYDNRPLQGQPRACDVARATGYKPITRRANLPSDPKALVWTGDTDIFIGARPDMLNGPMLNGQLFQVIFDPNGDSVPPI